MKRVVILVGLAAGAVGVVMLLMSMGGDDYKRERRSGGVDSARVGDREGSGEPGTSADGTAGADAAGAIDNDPNRTPGPDVTVSGQVLLNGTPVAGATVQLIRAQPTNEKLRRTWTDPLRRTESPTPIAEMKADEDGRFTLTGARRSQIFVRAWGENTSIGTARLAVPAEGNPGEVVVRVGPAHPIIGVVVNEEGTPVEGVSVTFSTGSWQSYPFLQQTNTAANGGFGFASLGRGAHSLIVEQEGYPTLHRTIAVPETTEIRIELVVGGTVSGTVTSDAGTPLAGARILFSSADIASGASGYGEATTDESGAYSVLVAVPGAIGRASVQHPDWGTRESTRGEVVLPRELIRAEKPLTWNIELATGLTVRGVVVDKDTQEPVPNAKLTFMRNAVATRNLQPTRRSETDADGRFEVEHLLEGSYAVDVRGDRHVRVVTQWVQPNQKLAMDFFVDGTKSPDPVRVEATGSGRVEGQFKADGIDDFKNTWIQVPELNNSLNARADTNGFYVFNNIPVGSPVTLKSWMPVAQSEPFTVEAGETKTVDLSAEGEPHFTGTVLGADGKPVVGAYVKAAMASNARNEFRQILQNRGWGSSRTDQEGRFSIRLQGWQLQQANQQKWQIAAVSFEYPLQVTKALSVPKDGASVDVQITLQPGGKISGTVEFEGRGLMPNARVSVSPHAADNAARRTDTRLGRYVFTDLAGRFSIDGIGEGEWRVTTSHPEGKAESQPATAGDSGVQLVLKPTLSLAGIVVDEDDKPLARASVAAIVPNGKKEQRRTATTDASGRFRIAQLDPGDYELEASPSRNQQMYYGGVGQQTGGFKKTRTRAYTAGTESIVIQVEPGNKISGRVLDERGKPVGGASVLALPMTPKTNAVAGRPSRTRAASSVPTTFTDGRGEFTLKGVGDGQYELLAIATGSVISSAQASVGQDDVTINLSDGATLEGILLDPDGKPMGGQWINLQVQDPEMQKKFGDWARRGGNTWNSIGGWQANATTTKADGSFKAVGLYPGKYRLNIYTQRGVVPNTELHTGAGKTTVRLTEGLTLSGRVVDEAGNVPVVPNGQLYISANSNGQWKSTQADADGNFELKGLSAGAVKLQIWAGNVYNATTFDAQAGDMGLRITLTKRAPPKPK